MKLVKSRPRCGCPEKNIDTICLQKICNKYDTATTEGCVLNVQSLRYQDFFVFNRTLPEMENLTSKDFTAA